MDEGEEGLLGEGLLLSVYTATTTECSSRAVSMIDGVSLQRERVPLLLLFDGPEEEEREERERRERGEREREKEREQKHRPDARETNVAAAAALLQDL